MDEDIQNNIPRISIASLTVKIKEPIKHDLQWLSVYHKKKQWLGYYYSVIRTCTHVKRCVFQSDFIHTDVEIPRWMSCVRFRFVSQCPSMIWNDTDLLVHCNYVHKEFWSRRQLLRKTARLMLRLECDPTTVVDDVLIMHYMYLQ